MVNFLSLYECLFFTGVLWRDCIRTGTRAALRPANRHARKTPREVDTKTNKHSWRPLLLSVSWAKCVTSCPPSVLLYVRSGCEEVFDALMLSTPTLSGLREAVSKSPETPVSPLLSKPALAHTCSDFSFKVRLSCVLFLSSQRFQKSTECKKTQLGKSTRDAKEGEFCLLSACWSTIRNTCTVPDINCKFRA